MSALQWRSKSPAAPDPGGVTVVPIGVVVDAQRVMMVLVRRLPLRADFAIQIVVDHLTDRVVEVIPVAGAGGLLLGSDSARHFVAASYEAILGFEYPQMELQERVVCR
jgi:hypothetical protein